jgi:hypothetical protein
VAVVDGSAGSGLQQGGQWRSFLRDLPVEPCKVQLFVSTAPLMSSGNTLTYSSGLFRS